MTLIIAGILPTGGVDPMQPPKSDQFRGGQ